MPNRPHPGAFPRSEHYTRHSENLQSVRATWKQLDRTHKALLRQKSVEQISAIEECQYLYLGIEAEARLRKILFDPTGFSADERDAIFAERTQIGRWLKVVSAAFSKHYLGAFSVAPDIAKLNPTAQARHSSLKKMLDETLRPVIENRNKIAHAQTVWQLKSGSDSAFKQACRKISYGDYWDLKQMRIALEEIGEIILILVVSRPTFERDFNDRFTRFSSAETSLSANLDGSELERFVRELGPIGGWSRRVTP